MPNSESSEERRGAGMVRTARRFLAIMATVATAGASAGAAVAQETLEPVGRHQDWFVYTVEDGGGRICWIASAPQRWTARRGNADVTPDVRRGEIRLMVAEHPGEGRDNEVSVVIGYPFREGSNAGMRIADDRFDLFTEGEMGWTENPEADARAIAAMRAGVEAVVTGTSSRGTVTTDTFSLIGFTAALEQAEALCQ
jgi:hypothetical protein